MVKRTPKRSRTGLGKLVTKIDDARNFVRTAADGISELAGRDQESQRVNGFDHGPLEIVDPGLLESPEPIPYTANDNTAELPEFRPEPEPEPIGATPEPGTAADTKQRGRPLGSRNGANGGASKAVSNIIADLESLLLSVHFMGAQILSIPEMELDQTEAAKLAASFKNVAKYYNVAVDPKKLALFELSTTVGAIYLPRVIAVMKKPREPKEPKQVGPQLVPKATAPQTAPQPPAPKLETPSQMWAESPVDMGGI